MTLKRLWWLGATGIAAVLVGALVAIPVWAAPSRQSDGPAPAPYDTTHEGCVNGDVGSMESAMDSLTEENWEAMEEHMDDGHHAGMGDHMTGEDWQVMQEHMNDGHHGAMGSGVMGRGGMMGGWPGAGSGWSRMMSW